VSSIQVTIAAVADKWEGTAVVVIVDDSGAPVNKATVQGDWSSQPPGLGLPVGQSQSTKGNGEATFSTGQVTAQPGNVFTFTVTSVSKSGYVYRPEQNVETSDSACVQSCGPQPTATSPATPIPTGTVASGPVISNVSAISITNNSALIVWDTNVSATSQVEYGKTPNYGSQTPLDPTLVPHHEVLLSGLSANTTYHYRVRSKNGAGTESLSGDYTFKTPK
jgi:hypothetical protein